MSYTFVQPGLNLCLYDSRVYAVTTTDFPIWRLYNLWIISAQFLIKWWLLLILSKSIVQISFRQSYQTVQVLTYIIYLISKRHYKGAQTLGISRFSQFLNHSLCFYLWWDSFVPLRFILLTSSGILGTKNVLSCYNMWEGISLDTDRIKEDFSLGHRTWNLVLFIPPPPAKVLT